MGKFTVDTSSEVETSCDSQATNDSDLNLDHLDDLDLPPHILFPDQLNRYLKEMVQQVKYENGSLRRSLKEIQDELEVANEKLTMKAPPAIVGRASEAAACKIAELSKKLREHTAELEVMKSRARDAEAKLRLHEEKIIVPTLSPPATPNNVQMKEKQIKALEEKLQSSNAKVCDFRNQCQSLRQDMKLAMKVIENEVGEKVVLQDIAKEGTNWRGRAQQIIALQNRLQQLQEQISSNGAASDTAASQLIRQMEKERRASHQETSKQLNQAVAQLEEVKKKWDVAKVRNKSLETDMVQVKAKMATLLDKAVRDEHLIAALTGQISALEEKCSEQGQLICKTQNQTKKVEKDLMHEMDRNDSLKKALSERDGNIKRLNAVVDEQKRLIKEWSQEHKEDATDTSVPVTVSHPTPERTKLLELIGEQHRRLDDARKAQEEAEAQLRKEKNRSAKLETKVSRLEAENAGILKTGRGSYRHGSCKGSETEARFTAQQQIEYLEEECLALRSKINMLEMEKEEDLKTYTALAELRARGVDRKSKKTSPNVTSRYLGIKSKSTTTIRLNDIQI